MDKQAYCREVTGTIFVEDRFGSSSDDLSPLDKVLPPLQKSDSQRHLPLDLEKKRMFLNISTCLAKNGARRW